MRPAGSASAPTSERTRTRDLFICFLPGVREHFAPPRRRRLERLP
jgi:hypothetical protein